MSGYEVRILRSAQKQLGRIAAKDRDRIVSALRKLEVDLLPLH